MKISRPYQIQKIEMMNRTNNPEPDESCESTQEKTSSELYQDLRGLLLGPEQQQLEELQTRLDDPDRRAEDLSNVLPDAITIGSSRDNQIARALQPVVDYAIKTSAEKNPKILADAIFPALGPGIRKAIVSIVMGMIQSLNQVLNHSFSVQGLKWRFEALRTRTTFAEIVLLHTLLYQVEQIFLIHKETGIVLLHVETRDVVSQDPDLVSGMLTAIQDFVQDSFHPETGDMLETLRVGSGRSVWIEQGQSAFLAAVIRGTPPLRLRNDFREVIETIHLKSGTALKEFDGDVSAFFKYQNLLEDGLQFRVKEQPAKTSPLLWVLLLLLIFGLGFWGWRTYQSSAAWKKYIEKIQDEHGLIPLSYGNRNGARYVWGLRDPLAKDPDIILKESGLDKSIVRSHWEGYYSLSPELILKRAYSILGPSQSVDLRLSGNTLIVEGEAANDWIVNFRRLASGIPGIQQIDDRHLYNLDFKELELEIENLKSIILNFPKYSDKLLAGQDAALLSATASVQKIQKLQDQLGLFVQILIIGHTDSSGNEKQNIRLSRNRAEKIWEAFIESGVNPSWISIVGLGEKKPLQEEETIEDRKFNRAVSFNVFMRNPAQGR